MHNVKVNHGTHPGYPHDSDRGVSHHTGDSYMYSFRSHSDINNCRNIGGPGDFTLTWSLASPKSVYIFKEGGVLIFYNNLLIVFTFRSVSKPRPRHVYIAMNNLNW